MPCFNWQYHHSYYSCNHILWGYFTNTWVIIWLSLCQEHTHERYGWNKSVPNHKLTQNCNRVQISLERRHNERDGVSVVSVVCSNRLFRRRSQQTSNIRVTGLSEGNPPVGSHHKGPVTRKCIRLMTSYCPVRIVACTFQWSLADINMYYYIHTGYQMMQSIKNAACFGNMTNAIGFCIYRLMSTIIWSYSELNMSHIWRNMLFR